MDDIKYAPQQLASVVEEQEVEIEAINDGTDGESKERQASDFTAKQELAPEVRSASPTKDEPQQQRLPLRPQGRGRHKRFTKKFNAPYIQQPSNNSKGERDGRQNADASLIGDDEKDEIVLSVQVPDHITLDSAFLHHEPPEPSPKLKPINSNSGEDKTSLTETCSPPLALASHNDALPDLADKSTVKLPFSPPPRRHRRMRMAGGESNTTLYQLHMLVDRTLAVEMKKNPDVKKALLDPEIKGPLCDLGLLGRFVRLLFRAKSRYQMNAWRNKRDVRVALRQREQWKSNHDHTPSGPVFRGALAMFSVPLYQDDVPPPRQAGVRGDVRENEDQDDGNQRFSALTTGVARNDSAIFDNDHDKDSLVWQAIKLSDRRYCAAAEKRSQQEAFSSDDEGSSTTSSEDDSVRELDYLSIASPSLPVRGKQDYFFGQNGELDPRRYETRPIPEQPMEEAAETKKQRREAKALAKKERQVRSKLSKQMKKEAVAVLQSHFTTMTDERDAALFERDEQRNMCDALRKENEQLTWKKAKFDNLLLLPDALSKELANVANEEAEEAKEAKETKKSKKTKKTKDTDVGMKHRSETGSGRAEQRDRVLPLSPVPTGRLPMKEPRHQFSRQPTTPLPPTMPNTPRSPFPWTPAAPVSDWDRWQIINGFQHALCEKVPQTPPSTPAFLPIHSARRVFPAAISVAYRIDPIRPPLGTGICLSALDVLLAVWLIIWRQIENFFEVLRWARFALLERIYFVSMVVISNSWIRLRQSVSKRARRELLTALTPAIRSPTSLAFRSRVTQLGQLYTPSTLTSAVRFPRDAMAELVLCTLVILVMATSIVAVLAAVTERNLWLSANGYGEQQQWFWYYYIKRHHGPYQIWLSLRMSYLG
ncbi:hypothetical protein SEPCBS57363_002930 [Sporothrix epigloea]|uniref:Uncharacterized protein n=1 Tax=Sporothrix epigloea TaxID=1892477 RepID=A0ABP0DMU9_9PEZI